MRLVVRPQLGTLLNASSTGRIDAAHAHPSDSTVAGDPRRCVASIAKRSGDRSEFIRLLARHLQTEFEVGLVAIVAPEYEQPIMLVVDEELGAQVHRPSIRQSLQRATLVATASEVALMDPSNPEDDPTGDPAGIVTGDLSDDASGDHEAVHREDDVDTALSVRGYRIELKSAPERLAVLLVHRVSERPTPAEQVQILRRLSLYGNSVRDLDSGAGSSDASTAEPTPPTSNPSPGTPPQIAGVNLTPIAGRPQGPSWLAQRRNLLQLHRSLEVDATAYRIANESRRLIGCDRVTVLVPRGTRLRVRAVSGVAVVDKRSNTVRGIERMVQRAIVLPGPLVLPQSDMLPPQIQEPLDDYLDQSGATCAVLLPIRIATTACSNDFEEEFETDPFVRDGELVGVILAEYFSGHDSLEVNGAMQVVASESSVALHNALEHESIFGLGVWKSIGRARRTGKRLWIAAAIVMVAALAIASVIVPVDHYIIATGSVEPTQRRQVFAAVDGVVKSLHVVDGQSVDRGTPLIQLENAELQRNDETIAGQIQTTLQRLASIKAVRLSGEGNETQSSRMAIEQQQFESELANLRSQHAIIQAQQEDLVVKSPIQGTVVGWQLEHRLSRRPVSRGNLLLSVVDESGPWELKLQIPDREAGALLESVKQSEALPVTFAVATQPDRSYHATLQGVATAARIDERKEAVIDATARVMLRPASQSSTDVFDPEDVKIGADVTARVYCGQRSVLRSWFSDVFDFINRNVMFYFR